MSHGNRYDAIIDRYINGEMAPAEEADFRKLLELDPELRRLFEADRRMVVTMHREREALEGLDHAESYSRFLMGLAASVPTTTGEAPPSDTGGRGSRWLLGGLGLLLVGTIVLAVMRHDPAPTPPRTGDTTHAMPSAAEPPAGVPGPRLSPSPSPAQREVPSRSSEDTGSPTRNELGDHPRSTPPRRIGSNDTGRAPERMPAKVRQSPERKREEIPTFEDDTIRTRLKVERSDR